MSNRSVAGDPSFFPALLAHLTANGFTLLDPVILQALLISLIVPDKHLIIRTQEEDIPLVAKLTAWMLSSIFGIPAVHRLRVKSRTSPDDVHQFLRSLFIPSVAVVSHDDNSVKSSFRRKAARSRPSHPRKHQARSVSYPNDYRGSQFPDPLGAMPKFVHSYSEPTPGTAPLELPNALVVFGLENAGFLSQKALTKVLAEKKIVFAEDDNSEKADGHLEAGLVGTWPLPDDFFVVYVCTMDSRESPPIHKTLLDHFALSVPVSMHSTVRANANAFFYPQHHHLSSSQPSTPQIIPLSLPSEAPLPPGVPESDHSLQPGISRSLLQSLRSAYRSIYFPVQLSLYTSDLFSAARHHPQLEGRLLTAKSRQDAEDLSKACRVVGVDLTGMELVENLLFSDSDSSQASLSSDHHLISPRTNIEEALGDIRGSNPVDDIVKIHEEVVPVLDVTETDVARMIPRVISHRLRVRDGPHSEILGSAVFGATHPMRRGAEKLKSRSTVKDILVDILSYV